MASLTAISFAFCDKDDFDGRKGLLRGPEVSVHGGKSWTWVQLDKQGNPESIGISINDKALNGVPIGSGTGHGHGGENSWVLKFNPVAGTVLPFNHVGMNWNPSGHEPEHFYGKPHFDFHFYSMTPQEVAAIPPYEVDSVKFKNWPAPEYFPANYINPGGGVPQMGAHWVDVTSGEFKGQPFTQTFIFGSYDGKVTFYEPMITQEFLKTQTNFQRSIPVPTKFQTSGWYPTSLKIVKHDGITDIILEKFVYRQKS